MRYLAVALAAFAACALAAAPDADRSATRAAMTAAPATRLDALRGERGDEQFARVLEVRPFEFPRDHGPHPDYRHEWWYITGNLDGPRGERFGFELTFFRFALAPPGPSVGESAWRTKQIYLAHFAVTDASRGEFHFSDRVARDALGLAGAQAQPFRVWLDGWSLAEQTGKDSWQLRVQDDAYALTLDLRAAGPPVANGDRGLSRKSTEPGAASYYYSVPRLVATGTLARGRTTFAVSGLAWLDREWGSGALGRDQEGWDWFALQLGNGESLMFYALRDRHGARDPHSAGTWIDAAGVPHTLQSGDVRIDVEDSWASPRGGRYPARWQVRVPAIGLDVDVRPILQDQELATSPRYWEGAVDVRGTRLGTAISGRGYVELVGYAR